MGRNEQHWAVFWCSILSPVLLGEIPEAQRERYFQKLTREQHWLPTGLRRSISARTFRRQWRRFKENGVQGLHRQRRSDRGKARKKHADLLARAVELKTEQPKRSDRVINRILKREFGRGVPRSTFYQHLHVRHIMLVADMMCMEGEVKQIGRHGIAGEKESVLSRAAFEVTVNHLLDAAVANEIDELSGVTENVIVGQPIQLGTGDVKLIAKPLN